MKRLVQALLGGLLVVLFMLQPASIRAARSALPSDFSREELGAGLKGPTAMAFDGSTIYVTEKSGAIQIINSSGDLEADPYAMLHVNTASERGLLGIALDPNFSANGFMYVYYTTDFGAKKYSGAPENRLSRLKKRPDGRIKERILLDHIPSTNGNHNGGDVHIGLGNKLFVSVGESGCCPQDAQGLNTLRGKILRLNLDGSIPTDNPFYNTPGARKETYAFGFRNPWRFFLRESNQSVIVADVGAGNWEEIGTAKRGKNHGWPRFEGPCPTSDLDCNPATVDYEGTIKPFHWYNHNTGSEQGNVISGGVIVEGSNYPSPYEGAYFYADTGAGWVHGLTFKNERKNKVTSTFEFDQLNAPVSFGLGPDGNLYVVDFGAGLVYRYVYAPSP